MTSIHTQIRVGIIALVAFPLLTTACSKSGGDNGPPPPPPPAATPVPVVTTAGGLPTQTPLTEPAPDGNANGNQTQGQTPPQNNGGHNAPPPALGGQNANGQNNSGPVNGHPNGAANNGQTTPPTPVGSEIVMDPTGLTPQQIFEASAQQGSPAPGMAAPTQAGPPLVYSGAGQDNLHDQLTALANAEKTPDKVAVNKKLAQQIGMATFEVDWNTRLAKFSVDVGPTDNRTNLTFTGHLDNQLRMNGGDVNTKPGLAFKAVCMDDSGGCHTVHVRIQKKIGSQVAVANVIARLSSAYLYIEGNEAGVSHNQEYDNLLGLFLNTVSDRGGPDSVQALAFYSSETINGGSDFAILMRMGVQDPQRAAGQAQMFGLLGPLVKPPGSAMENISIPNPPTEATVIGRHTFLLSNLIANSIREIRMVRNDGRGNLQFDITVRKGTAQANEDTIRLTIARIQTGTRMPILPAR